MQRDYWYSSMRQAGDLASPEAVGRYAAHRALSRFAEQWPQAQAIQLVRECKAEVDQGSIGIRDAAQCGWLG